MKYYLGIDIGGTHIKGGIVNLLTNDIQHQASLRKSEKLLLTFKPVCPYLN